MRGRGLITIATIPTTNLLLLLKTQITRAVKKASEQNRGKLRPASNSILDFLAFMARDTYLMRSLTH